MYVLGHPVDLGVTGDGLVVGVDHDDLEVLVGRVLVYPVRVENPQVSALGTDSLLSNRPQVPDNKINY